MKNLRKFIEDSFDTVTAEETETKPVINAADVDISDIEGSAVDAGDDSEITADDLKIGSDTKKKDDSETNIEEKAAAEAATDEKPAVATPPAGEKQPDTKPDATAPQSWRGEAKQLWGTLPEPIRKEVMRREREIVTKLQETELDRRKVNEVTQVITPHMARINELYDGNPMAAINALLTAEQKLTQSSSAARAEFVADIVRTYDVDIAALDAALANKPMPQKIAREDDIENLLSQRLAPFEQFLRQQQQLEEQQRQQIIEQAATTVSEMENDPKYPLFNDVREDMADIIEFSARRGVELSLDEAYTRAVRMIGGTVETTVSPQQSQVSGATQAALAAHRAAQAAKGASRSVGGSPSTGNGQNTGNPKDLRATIERAFDGN